MGVKEQMIGILRSNETQRINFSFTGTTGATISVNGRTLSQVAEALSDDRISIVENAFTTDIAMYSARSENGRAANTFYLGRNPRWSRNFNGLIVHESLHAFFDLNRTTIPWIDNEAAAYIAQGYYLRNSGYSRDRLQFGSQASIGYALVNEIFLGNDTQFFLDALRNSLNADPRYHSYISGTFTGDG
jgi:hypothetical protein